MVDVKLNIPQSHSPAYMCQYCEHPYPERERLVLHKGLEHPAKLDEEEKKAFQQAYEEEAERLQSFRLKGMIVIVLIYFTFLIMYAIFA